MSTLNEPWLQFNHLIVRQLAFVIASPNIIQAIPPSFQSDTTIELHSTEFWNTQYEQYYTRLTALDKNPKELIDFLAKLKSTRLGLRFEYLMWFWLQDSEYHDYEILGHSIQIIEAKNTLGEIDFLVKNKVTYQIEHWEVALKYYLAESEKDLTQWYGLNRSDTLFRKLNHFFQKQFQFSKVNGYQIEKKKMILKGQLYFPLEFSLENLPLWVNQNRRVGYWGVQPLENYYRLERQEWICKSNKTEHCTSKWWTSGLYHHIDNGSAYMYRQSKLQIPFLRTCNFL